MQRKQFRFFVLPVAALALVSSASNGADGERTFIERFMGEPYTGFLKVRIQPPEGNARTQWGSGSAQFIQAAGGNAKLVVFGAIDDEKGDAGFAIEGHHDEDSWNAEAGKIRMEVRRAGKITGGGTADAQQFAFVGAVSPSSFDLRVTIELLKPTANGMPAGTTFRFEYDLTRADPRKKEAQDDRSANPKKCRKIRYEMRPVANIGEGTMSMLRVPVCLK